MPSRHCGSEPSNTSHSVGGSSSTGAKFPESTVLGSSDGLIGGSRKFIMISSSALNISVGNERLSSFLLASEAKRDLMVITGSKIDVGEGTWDFEAIGFPLVVEEVVLT